MHALIVEDDQNSIEVLARLLAVESLTSTSLQDPGQVHRVLESLDSFDIVFLDLEMPKLSGYDVFTILTQDYGISVPIVAYTVHSSEIDNARSAGFHSFLGKPLDPTQFPLQLAHILNDEPVWEIA